MFNVELIAEILGWLGVCLIITSNLLKTGKGILGVQGVGNVFWTLHFFMMGSISGGLTCLICTCRSFIGAYCNGKLLRNLIIIAIFLPFIVVYMTTNDAAGYFAASAASLVSLTAFFRERTSILRALNLIATCLWLSFAILISSSPMIFAEVLGGISIICGAVKHEEVFAPLRSQFRQTATPRWARQY